MMDEPDRKKFIYKVIALPSYNLLSFAYKEVKDQVPIIKEDLSLSLSGYCTVLGNRLIFNPDLFTRFGSIPYKNGVRKSEIYIRRSTIVTDSVKFLLPDHYKIEKVPQKQSIASSFGDYTSEILTDSGSIIYVRSLSIKKGIYPVSSYKSFIEFCEGITLADENKVSLLKE
jgi:hypothetical protein